MDKVYRIIALILIFALMLPTVAIAQTTNPAPLTIADRQATVVSTFELADLDKAIQTEDGRVRIIVELDAPPVALYTGGLPGLAATSIEVTGARKLDLTSSASVAYLNYLQREQNRFTSALARVAATAEVDYRYQVAFNGLAVAVDPQEVTSILKMEGVKAVYPDQLRSIEMDASLDLINAPALWNELGGQENAGAGIIVAVIDTGIRPEHPMFSGDGFTSPPGYPKGYCVTSPADPDFQCNGKLIAARYYTPTFPIHAEEVLSPLDIDGHGSHTAGTSAGNPVEVSEPSIAPAGTEISGVAPAAYLMAYKGLFHTPDGGGSGTDSMLLAALNDALADGADVINNSWGGGAGGDPNTSVYQTPIKSLVSSGVVVVFSAGNSGPDPNTIGCPSCIEETISVAASTTTRRFIKTLDILGPGTVPENLQDIEIKPGNGPSIVAPVTAPIEYAGAVDLDNFQGCDPFPAGAFAGSIALIQRGVCTFETKVNNAADAGASVAIIFNNQGDELISMAVAATTIPSYFMGQTNGEAVRDWIMANTGVTALINFAPIHLDIIPDALAGFSSAGPNGDPDVLKPDITAPGVDILSAYSPALNELNYNQISGTSMSAPHITGAVALMKQLKPFWTPAQIKTALTSTSVQLGVLKPDNATQADPFNMGAGRVDLDRARQAGLTFDKPSFAEGECLLNCSWARTLQNVAGVTTTWTASLISAEGLSLEVSPATITLGPNRSSAFVVNADVTLLEPGAWYFGAVVWSEASGNYPDAYLPLAVSPSASTSLASLTKEVDQQEAGPGDTLDYTITLTNNFPNEVTYSLHDPIPENASYITGTATGGLTYDADQDALVAEVTLEGLSLDIIPEDSPFGFFPLASGIGGTSLCGFFSGCDEALVNLTLDTPFEYLGQTYDRIAMVSNGYLIPGGGDVGSITFLNQLLPDTTAPNNVIAPFWTDLDLDGAAPDDPGGGTWYFAVLTDGIDEFLVVEWEDAEQWGDPTTTYTFQAWIELGTSNIWFVYEDLPADLSTYGATVGAENASGEAGATYYYVPNDLSEPPTGTEPEVDTDLSVEAVTDSATFNFSLLVDPLGELGSGQALVTNIVQVLNDQNADIMTAWATTVINIFKHYFPLVMRNGSNP